MDIGIFKNKARPTSCWNLFPNYEFGRFFNFLLFRHVTSTVGCVTNLVRSSQVIALTAHQCLQHFHRHAEAVAHISSATYRFVDSAVELFAVPRACATYIVNTCSLTYFNLTAYSSVGWANRQRYRCLARWLLFITTSINARQPHHGLPACLLLFPTRSILPQWVGVVKALKCRATDYITRRV